MIFNNNESDIDVIEEEKQDQKNLMNKAAGYVIKKYIYEIKKYKIDTIIKQIPTTADDLYELIKYLALNDKEFHKYTVDNYKIRIYYNKEKDHFYVEYYN